MWWYRRCWFIIKISISFRVQCVEVKDKLGNCVTIAYQATEYLKAGIAIEVAKYTDRRKEERHLAVGTVGVVQGGDGIVVGEVGCLGEVGCVLH